MIVSMLLPLVLAGVPAAPVLVADPPVRIDLNERVYRPGDRAKVKVRTDADGYLLVFQVDVDGNLRVLFPLDPFDDSYVRGGRRMELDGRGDRETFIVEANEGQGWVYAAYSTAPFQVERYALGDHWDYRRLSPDRLPQAPEPELTELVRGIARASFDYDIVPYTVSGRQVATTVVHRYDPFYDDCFGCGYYGPRYRSSFSIHIGGPSRYYGGCWDAYWCDPYYYDPFYYRPRYVYYAPRYYRPYYYGPVYRPRYAGHNRPFSPSFGAGVPYRDRRADGGTGIRLVSGNTAYAPPPRRAASGFAESPARRQIEETSGYDLTPATPGRRTGIAPSTSSRDRETPATSEGRTPARTTGRVPERTPDRAADRPATEARPSTAEPRTRTAEPRTGTAEPRTGTAEPRRPATETPARRSAEPGPRESGIEPAGEVEARPSRPRAERPAAPSRARTEARTPSADRSSSADRPSSADGPRTEARPTPSAPERRSTPQAQSRPQPQARSSGGEARSSGGETRSSGSSARPAPSSRSGGSAPASGGGRRRSP